MEHYSSVGSPRKWYVMAAVAIGIFLATIDASIVNIALPMLERGLRTHFALVEWVVLAYLMTVTTLMLTIGQLADMVGKKPIYVAGMVVFTASSVLCGQRFDLPGAACLFVALLSLLLSLTIGQTKGYARTPAIALFVAFAAFLIVFLAIESRSRQPMIDLQLFKNPLFSINLVTGFLAFISSAGTILLMPYYLQEVRQYSPLTTGLLLAVVPAAVAVVAPAAGSLSDRLGTRPLAAIGLGTLIVGYAAASTLRIDTGIPGYILRFLPLGLGIGLFQSPNNSAIMGAVPRERLGVASGLLSLTRTSGQTVGIATVAALWAAQVAAHSGKAVPDKATIAPASIQVTALNETLHVIVGLIVMALLLSLWALRQERRRQAPHLPHAADLADPDSAS